MRDIEVNADWMGTLLVALIAVVCVIGFVYDLVCFIGGKITPIRPAGWADYVVVGIVLVSLLPIRSGWKHMGKSDGLYSRMLQVWLALWTVRMALHFPVSLRYQIGSNPQLMWSDLLLGVAAWAFGLIGVIDWFRVNVKFVPPSPPPGETTDSSL